MTKQQFWNPHTETWELREVMERQEWSQLEDAICEGCTWQVSLYCPRCKVFVCKHLSIEAEEDMHLCIYCEREIIRHEMGETPLEQVQRMLPLYWAMNPVEQSGIRDVLEKRGKV